MGRSSASLRQHGGRTRASRRRRNTHQTAGETARSQIPNPKNNSTPCLKRAHTHTRARRGELLSGQAAGRALGAAGPCAAGASSARAPALAFARSARPAERGKRARRSSHWRMGPVHSRAGRQRRSSPRRAGRAATHRTRQPGVQRTCLVKTMSSKAAGPNRALTTAAAAAAAAVLASWSARSFVRARFDRRASAALRASTFAIFSALRHVRVCSSRPARPWTAIGGKRSSDRLSTRTSSKSCRLPSAVHPAAAWVRLQCSRPDGAAGNYTAPICRVRRVVRVVRVRGYR